MTKVDSTKLKVDAEFKSLVPKLSAEEYAGLEASILADGCRDNGVSWNSIIIDGHNRYEICRKHGVAFVCREHEFEDRDDAKIWIINNQFSRRNLTDMQRVELALKLKPLLAEKSRERMEGGVSNPSLNSDEGRTDGQIAKLAGVGRDTINKVEKILDNATPLLAEAVRQGDVSINAAATVAALPKREQASLVREGPKAVKEKAAEIRADKSKADEPPPRPPASRKSAAPAPKKEDAISNMPPKVRDAFSDDAETITPALKLHQQLTALVNRLVGDGDQVGPSPAGQLILTYNVRQDLLAKLKDVRRIIAGYRPHSVCPYCEGKKAKCEGCKGFGWVAKDTFESAPSELKAAVRGVAA